MVSYQTRQSRKYGNEQLMGTPQSFVVKYLSKELQG